jgi:hypothetical protein
VPLPSLVRSLHHTGPHKGPHKGPHILPASSWGRTPSPIGHTSPAWVARTWAAAAVPVASRVASSSPVAASLVVPGLGVAALLVVGVPGLGVAALLVVGGSIAG